MITWKQLRFQDAVSPLIEEFIYFHDFTLLILSVILIAVGVIMIGALININLQIGLLASHSLERIWTFFPGLILLQIAVPSLILLYRLDEGQKSSLTIKAVGHQWYWSYEYTDFYKDSSLELESYMNPAPGNNLRLLDVDNRTVLPYLTQVRVLATRTDVLHAWTVPSLGVKADACPGRLNQMHFTSLRPGVFYGQCSEICGANHRFIPIRLEMVNSSAFLNWLSSNLE